MKLGLLIPAAGQGKRMKARKNKQFLMLRDKPLLAHTIGIFFKNPIIEIDQIIVVVRKEERAYCQKEIIDKYFDNTIKLVTGGETRRQSVFNGLKSFSPSIDYVIIHDGARPLLPREVIGKLINSVKRYQAVTLGVKMKDTIKKIDKEGQVISTLNRNELVSIQTPQAFKYELIMKAHKEVSDTERVTDDASLVELYGHQVIVVEGSYENIKVTTHSDLVISEAILKNRGR